MQNMSLIEVFNKFDDVSFLNETEVTHYIVVIAKMEIQTWVENNLKKETLIILEITISNPTYNPKPNETAINKNIQILVKYKSEHYRNFDNNLDRVGNLTTKTLDNSK